MAGAEPAVVAAPLNGNTTQVCADADVDKPLGARAALSICLGVLHGTNDQIVGTKGEIHSRPIEQCADQSVGIMHGMQKQPTFLLSPRHRPSEGKMNTCRGVTYRARSISSGVLCLTKTGLPLHLKTAVVPTSIGLKSISVVPAAIRSYGKHSEF